jgi:DNA-binding GntR family transcriptional regulator
MNQRFHAIIGEMADNEYLMPSLRRLLIDHTRISMTFYNPRNPSLAQERNLAADQHDQFIALIEMGDADSAATLAIDHWELSRAEIESFVTPRGMQIPLGHAPGDAPRKGAS